MKKSLIIVCLLVLLSGFAAAQITNPQTTTVDLNAVLAEQFTVTFTNAAGINWPALTPGVANTSTDMLNISTKWLLSKARTRIDIFGYFGTADALTGSAGGQIIPTSEVFPVVGVTKGGPFTSKVDTIDNASLFYSYPIDNGNRNNLTGDTKNVTLQIDLTGHPQLAADTYTGVLHVQAQVF